MPTSDDEIEDAIAAFRKSLDSDGAAIAAAISDWDRPLGRRIPHTDDMRQMVETLDDFLAPPKFVAPPGGSGIEVLNLEEFSVSGSFNVETLPTLTTLDLSPLTSVYFPALVTVGDIVFSEKDFNDGT